MMQPLIDADVLVYEVGFAAEVAREEGEVPPFDQVADMLENRVSHICAIVDATHPPILFFTGEGNFRNDIAKTVLYKQRQGVKPFHYKNIKAYLKSLYEFRQENFLEADDLLAIEQTARPSETIICTRDKDLFSFPGWKYSWELGKQPQRGPLLVTEIGTLEFDEKRKTLKGSGGLFFLAQCLMGDPVDTIPGLPKFGPKKSFDLLSKVSCLKDALNRVLDMYIQVYGDLAREKLLEQARLLHMIQHRKGSKILLWGFPEDDFEDWYDINTREIERVPKLQS